MSCCSPSFDYLKRLDIIRKTAIRRAKMASEVVHIKPWEMSSYFCCLYSSKSTCATAPGVKMRDRWPPFYYNSKLPFRVKRFTSHNPKQRPEMLFIVLNILLLHERCSLDKTFVFVYMHVTRACSSMLRPN